jgi:hypothetical protein
MEGSTEEEMNPVCCMSSCNKEATWYVRTHPDGQEKEVCSSCFLMLLTGQELYTVRHRNELRKKTPCDVKMN